MYNVFCCCMDEVYVVVHMMLIVTIMQERFQTCLTIECYIISYYE